MAQAKPTTKKASVTTELVLGQAAQQITKAVTELNGVTGTIGKLAAQAEELTLQVANKEEAIAALEVAYAEKERQLNVDLDLSFKANTERVVSEFLRSTGKVSISGEELQNLRQELAETKANADAETKKQVAQATASIKSDYENAIKLLHSENKAVAAENAAKIGTLGTQNSFLQEQVTKLYAQLDAERQAGIERAKAGSVGSINIGDGNRK